MNRPRIILVIASSLDGRIAFPNGGGSHLGSHEDKKILNQALLKVDATLFGSGTLKAHQNTYLVKEDQTIFSKQPISIIVGNAKEFNINWSYFKQPIKRWLINSNNDNSYYGEYENYEKIFAFRDSWRETLPLLKKEGIQKIALLGGSKLINSFAIENLIDEINITFIPKILGGKYTWISNESHQFLNQENEWDLVSIKRLSTNEIFMQYIKKI